MPSYHISHSHIVYSIFLKVIMTFSELQNLKTGWGQIRLKCQPSKNRWCHQRQRPVPSVKGSVLLRIMEEKMTRACGNTSANNKREIEFQAQTAEVQADYID